MRSSLIAWLAPALLALASAPAAADILTYAGATTLQRFFMPEAAQLFRQETGISFRIDGGNTDPGLRALQAGQVVIAGAGRFLRPQEKAAGLVETLIGWDAMVVVVHRSNPVSNLSRQQLQGIFTGRIANWREVGGEDQPILAITSPRGSGMRAAVQQDVLGGQPYTPREIISVLVADGDRQVAGLPAGIAILSTSMVDAPEAKILQVDGILPDEENVAEGHYPLVKPLLLVTRGKPTGTAARFIEFALGQRGQEIMARKFHRIH